MFRFADVGPDCLWHCRPSHFEILGRCIRFCFAGFSSYSIRCSPSAVLIQGPNSLQKEAPPQTLRVSLQGVKALPWPQQREESIIGTAGVFHDLSGFGLAPPVVDVLQVRGWAWMMRSAARTTLWRTCLPCLVLFPNQTLMFPMRMLSMMLV